MVATTRQALRHRRRHAVTAVARHGSCGTPWRRRHAVAAAHATAATCAGPQRGAEGRVLPFLCHPGQAPLAQSETAKVSGVEVIPVDTTIHEGLPEPQDPSGLRSNLASGSTWPEVPPGLRVHLASGSTWPQVTPGLRLHLTSGSTWPQGPPGHLAPGFS